MYLLLTNCHITSLLNGVLMNKFYVEVPHLKFDYDALLDYYENITEWNTNKTFLSGYGRDSAVEDLWFDYYPSHPNKVFDDIIANINADISLTDFKFTKQLAGGKVPWHIDPIRTSVLMIPLKETDDKIEWMDANGNILESHQYTCPTVINATRWHGCPEVKQDRLSLQVSIPYLWRELLINYNTLFGEVAEWPKASDY